MPGEQGRAVALQSPVLQTTTVSILQYSSDELTVEYHGLPPNQPKTYQNYLGLWEASVIPWPAPPDKRVEIPTNVAKGKIVLTGLKIEGSSYIVGYAVGPDLSNYCATVVVSAGGLRAAPSSIQLGIESIGSTSIAISYSTISGYLPKTSGNWVGLWAGYASPYYCPEPLGIGLVETDSTEGSVAINGVYIGFDTTYTLVYFVGNPAVTKNNALAAAILTFTTDSVVNAPDEP